MVRDSTNKRGKELDQEREWTFLTSKNFAEEKIEEKKLVTKIRLKNQTKKKSN